VIVLDSSFLVAFLNTRDAHHRAAKVVVEGLVRGDWGPALLPEYVFLEVVTVLAARRSIEVAISAADVLLRAREVEFVPCSQYFLATLETFRREARFGLSFADAAIVAVQRARHAPYVATFDADFRKIAGVTVVP
jgi:predicted nucleic acid-binding protein